MAFRVSYRLIPLVYLVLNLFFMPSLYAEHTISMVSIEQLLNRHVDSLGVISHSDMQEAFSMPRQARLAVAECLERIEGKDYYKTYTHYKALAEDDDLPEIDKVSIQHIWVPYVMMIKKASARTKKTIALELKCLANIKSAQPMSDLLIAGFYHAAPEHAQEIISSICNRG